MEQIHNPYAVSAFNVFMDDVRLFQLKACLIHLKNCSYSGNSKRCDSMLTHSTWCTLGFYYLKRKSWRRFHLWLPLVWSDSPIEVILLVTDFDHIQLIFRFSNTSTEQAHLLLSDPVVVRRDLVISDFFWNKCVKKVQHRQNSVWIFFLEHTGELRRCINR